MYFKILKSFPKVDLVQNEDMQKMKPKSQSEKQLSFKWE